MTTQQLSEQQEFERLVFNALTNPKPKPKYERWQRVALRGTKPQNSERVEEGCIVGFYWQSVAWAFENTSTPGWCYVVEVNGNHHLLDEDYIDRHSAPFADSQDEAPKDRLVVYLDYL